VNDIAALATALTDLDPSGPNLEYDPDFLALERAQRGRPEQVMGNTVKPAEDPDWSDVRDRAEALLARSRDLRLAVTLTAAQLRLDGLRGLTGGLTLIQRLLEEQWDTVHPRLDAEDDNDPTSRVNSLLGLAMHKEILQPLRECPVVRSKTLGRFGLRDIRIATGKLQAPDGATDVPGLMQIEAAFRDADLGELQGTAATVAAALECVMTIARIMYDKVGPAAPDLAPLVADLNDLKKILDEHVAARAGHSSGVAQSAGVAQEFGLVPVDLRPGTSGIGEVTSRDEVVRQLDRLCEYYRRYEPSSPLPLLLQRAKRLVAKDFMEIIRDLTPSGLPEAESLRGVVKEDD